MGLTFGLVGFLVPLALGALIGQLVYDDLRARAGRGVAAMAQQMSDQLDRELDDVRTETRLLADSLRVRGQHDPDALRGVLNDFQELTPQVAWAGYVRPDGRVVAATGRLLEGVSIADRPVFREAREAPFLGGLHPAKLLDRHLGDPARAEPLRFLDVSAPVRRSGSGQLQGVIATHIGWSWADDVRQRMLATAAPARGLSFAIFGPEGEVLLEPMPPGPGLGRGAGAAGFVRDAAASSSEGDWQLVDPSAREDIVRSVEDGGIGLGWEVMAYQSADVAFAPARAAWRTTLAFSLGAGLLAGLLGWLLGRRMGGPVLALASAADEIREGYEGSLPVVNGSRELAVLASALRDLVDGLRRESQLQKRNLILQNQHAEAERSSRAKSIFLANMNHELRTPLNAVLGFAQMMRLDPRTPLPEAHAERARQIERAGQHLTLVINDVLVTAQAEAGELEVTPETMDLADALRDSLDLVRTDAEDAGVRLPHQLPAGSLPVMGDPLRVRQILVNLLTNALKYNTRGGTVALVAERVDDQVVLSVFDDGPGVDPREVERLFEPFNRGEAATAGKGGIGLGLPLSRMLAERMGGTLGLANRDEGGAVARLSLPAAPREPDA